MSTGLPIGKRFTGDRQTCGQRALDCWVTPAPYLIRGSSSQTSIHIICKISLDGQNGIYETFFLKELNLCHHLANVQIVIVCRVKELLEMISGLKFMSARSVDVCIVIIVVVMNVQIVVLKEEQ